MGTKRSELQSELEETDVDGGRNPRLDIGTYLLMVTRAAMIVEERDRKKPRAEQSIQGHLIVFKVLEATPGAANPAGTMADKYFRYNASGWKHEKDKKDVRKFLEAVTGAEIDDLDLDELYDEYTSEGLKPGEMRGLLVRCQVVPGKREGWPDSHWTHVEQSAEDVERRRAEL